jgi:hypothetical protein
MHKTIRILAMKNLGQTCLMALMMSISLLACSPKEESTSKAETQKTFTANSIASPFESPVKVTSEDVADLVLAKRLTQAASVNTQSGAMLQGVDVEFVGGKVRACVRLRTSVSNAAEPELAEQVTITPVPRYHDLAVQDGMLCATNLAVDTELHNGKTRLV